ncbi:MAG: DUF2769 domain-containing protein [Candidatus Nanoarchaeia archaeon]|nr:DUF2769 domain-containing protein [Candidatus Nanoarchaeia archaeon]
MEKTEAIKLCICKSCPTYRECRERVAFCFLGRSKCIKEDHGCICGGCPVHDKANVKRYDYCLKGSEKQQK